MDAPDESETQSRGSLAYPTCRRGNVYQATHFLPSSSSPARLRSSGVMTAELNVSLKGSNHGSTNAGSFEASLKQG